MTTATEEVKRVTIKEGRDLVQALNTEFGSKGWDFTSKTNMVDFLGISARHQDGRAMTDEERQGIDAFLEKRKVVTKDSQEISFPKDAISVEIDHGMAVRAFSSRQSAASGQTP